MRLYEFIDENPLVTKIVVVTDQLKADLKSGKIDPTWNVDDLLNYFKKYDVILDRTDLYNMIQQPPMNTVIKNIQGDQIVFKGQDSEGEIQPDESHKVVDQMAKKAMKR